VGRGGGRGSGVIRRERSLNRYNLFVGTETLSPFTRGTVPPNLGEGWS